MDDEKGKFQFAGLKFLFDMEMIDDPQLINHLKLNVFRISRHIKDVEFLSSYHHRSMLIYLDLNWFGRKFFAERLASETLNIIKQLLSNFRFRVTTDRKIFDMALDRVKVALKGATNEKVSDSSNKPDGSGDGPSGSSVPQ